MTAHAPAVPRLRADLAGLLSRVRRRRRGDGDPDEVGLHLHDRPRAFARTSAGDMRLELRGACFYADALVFRFQGRATERATVESMTVRVGDRETVVPQVPARLEAGDAFGLSFAIAWPGEPEVFP